VSKRYQPSVRFLRGVDPAKRRFFRKFCYSVADIAEARGIKPASVRMAVYRGKLELDNLLSVARYLLLPEIRAQKNK
jgi:hypothetical protein